MTCVLVAVLWGQSFYSGLYKVCVYDCGQKRPSYMWYDKSYVVHPNYVCPARFYKT